MRREYIAPILYRVSDPKERLELAKKIHSQCTRPSKLLFWGGQVKVCEALLRMSDNWKIVDVAKVPTRSVPAAPCYRKIIWRLYWKTGEKS